MDPGYKYCISKEPHWHETMLNSIDHVPTVNQPPSSASGPVLACFHFQLILLRWFQAVLVERFDFWNQTPKNNIFDIPSNLQICFIPPNVKSFSYTLPPIVIVQWKMSPLKRWEVLVSKTALFCFHLCKKDFHGSLLGTIASMEPASTKLEVMKISP